MAEKKDAPKSEAAVTLKSKPRTVIEFLACVKGLVGDNIEAYRPVLYRGHRDITRKLVPEVARFPFRREHRRSWMCRTKDQKKDRSAERGLYNFFREWAASVMPAWALQGDPKEASWRILVLARHHGLPTRLLDWSTNPLV